MASSNAQENRFQCVDDDLGPVSTIIHMMQDSYGYIWASTLSGVIRYDGYEYVNYVKSDSTDGLPDVYAYTTFEDNYQNIWISIYDYGLAILDRDKNVFIWIKADTSSKDGLHLRQINAIAGDGRNNIYLLGNDGIQRVQITEEKYENLPFQSQEVFLPSIKEKIAGRCMLFDSRENIWIGTNDGFITMDQHGDLVYQSEKENLMKAPTQSILEDSSEVINIVRSGLPLLQYDGNNFTEDSAVVFPSRNILATIDTDQNLWAFIRPSNILKYNLPLKKLESTKSFELPYNIQGTYFRSPFISKEGTLWLGGAGTYPFQHQPKTNKEITPIIYDESKQQSSTSTYEDDYHIYITQVLEGLKVINKKTGDIQVFNKDNSLIHDNRLYQLIPIGADRLFITGRGGVYLFDKRKQAITKQKKIPHLIRCGHYMGDDIMWIGGETRQIFEIDLRDMTMVSIFQKMDGLPDLVTITQIVKDSDGSIWLAGRQQGVYHYYPNDGTWQFYSTDSKDPRYKITSTNNEALYIDDDGKVWLGSRAGIDIIDKDKNSITTLGKNEGLADLHVCDIIQDDSLHYWILTEKYISKIDKHTRAVTNFDSKDGFINNKYYYRSFEKYNGSILAAGSNGVDRFNPFAMGDNQVPSTLVISKVKVMGKPYAEVITRELKSIEVDYNQKYIEIECKALHYVCPEKNEIAYKVEGIHDEYVNIETNKTISLSGLSSGSHSIKIKGSNSDGVWSQPKELTLNVAFPWWRTWTFFISLFFLTGLTLWYFIKRYTDGVKKEQEEKAKISSQFAELELKALSSQMNPHFLFNSLNSIKSLINQNLNTEANNYITKYSRLIRQVLNNSRSKFVRLEDELETIKLYLELEKLRLGDGFQFHISVEDDVATDFIEVPPSLLQPYVENAIWHGLLNKTDGNKLLLINVKQQQKSITIEIIDNGIGRQAASIIQKQSRLKNKSLGTLISKERNDLLSNIYGYKTRVNTIDNTDTDQASTGTTVEIIIYLDD